MNANGSTGCGRSTQLFASTANPLHLRPTSVAMTGHTDQANHQYDVQDFFSAVTISNLPAVSFLKAPSSQDSHPGNSDPVDEQIFISTVINARSSRPIGQRQPSSSPMTIPTVGTTTRCRRSSTSRSRSLPAFQGRCGYGTRIPFLVVSPWSKINFVDHTLLDQSSVSRFVEDNWLQGQRLGFPNSSFDSIANTFDFSGAAGTAPTVFLQPTTGVIVSTPPAATAQAK
jgi:phospholipase C